jgi:hypothetical protein
MPRGRIKSSPLVVGVLSPWAKDTSSTHSLPQAQPDRESLTRTLEDYIHAWFRGDVEAMERCLHPDLTARLLQLGPDSGDASRISLLARTQGIQASLGACTHPMARDREITILDVSGHSASARAILGDWVAYVHLSFTGERWVIVNVLWEWLSPRDRRSA